MGDAGLLKRIHDSQPLVSKMQKHIATVEHFTHVKIERGALDPFHKQDRESRAADEYAFRRVAERRKIRHRRRENMFLNRAVTLVAVTEIAAKTANGEVAVAIHRLELVDVGKL